MTAEQERAAVVRWLRELAGPLPEGSIPRGEVWVLNRAADAIEQGQHIKETPNAD
ncbi:hypothetical protein [Sphingopyxis sp. JAI128]|uniref:hypothetical protein n=1 Tax=Sphingopyxis sp. JAI128 TaxID=2723066 RepID=UPI001617A876|nr:hypothetical protein [Sphingopyxis sp. JAI128]MBB6424920.1 hypothetical protein [Sphingopyxis sp. JAI128]